MAAVSTICLTAGFASSRERLVLASTCNTPGSALSVMRSCLSVSGCLVERDPVWISSSASFWLGDKIRVLVSGCASSATPSATTALSTFRAVPTPFLTCSSCQALAAPISLALVVTVRMPVGFLVSRSVERFPVTSSLMMTLGAHIEKQESTCRLAEIANNCRGLARSLGCLPGRVWLISLEWTPACPQQWPKRADRVMERAHTGSNSFLQG